MRLTLLVLPCLLLSAVATLAQEPAEPPFEITEDRPRCDHYEANRQPRRLEKTTHPLARGGPNLPAYGIGVCAVYWTLERVVGMVGFG